MKRYKDFPGYEILNDDAVWTKFKIIVPTEEDKKEIEDAIEHIHYGDIDTQFISVNQIAHVYEANGIIIVDKELYGKLEKENKVELKEDYK